MKRSFSVLMILLLGIYGCHWFCRTPSVDCTKRGSRSIFVADFESDVVGSPPASSTPLHYGPPGASLNVQCTPAAAKVVNSTELGSKALRLSRQSSECVVDAVVGDVGDAPYSTGVYYIEFKAHGEVIPLHLIAGTTISVRSSKNKAALVMTLYEGSYHLLQGNTSTRLAGSYDPGRAHTIHIELNMNTKKVSLCINNQLVISNRDFSASGFEDLHSLQFYSPATITEAFESVYVVDDLRMTK
jgi:hypothetical protein